MMSNLIDHAKRELQAAGYNLDSQEDGPNKWICENLLELLEVFSKQGHSGFSALYCIDAFKRLASFEPLGPLTGEDSEWVKVQDDLWQNIRASHVFKGQDGVAYDIDGRIFREPDGCCYTSSESRKNITFPYTPKREYVDVGGHDERESEE